MANGTVDRPVRKFLGQVMFKAMGWRAGGEVPDVPKFVVIAAPHTSNWDGPILVACSYVMGVDLHWMVKHTVFRPPFAGIIRWLGGVAIDRRGRHDIVRQMIDEFARREYFVLAVPPEGTRKKTQYWKTGFYRIALGAGVPIVFGYLDYARKEGGLGPCFMPTGDIEADLETIRAFYADKTGKFPEQFTNAAFPPAETKARKASDHASAYAAEP